jgi:hypothetical protein
MESFWINAWLKKHYKGLETRFIIHDATAKEVDEDTFFKTSESGGTLISSAYKIAQEMIEKDYSPHEWNIYPFHFSDGDNWSGEDTRFCVRLLKEFFLEKKDLRIMNISQSYFLDSKFIQIDFSNSIAVFSKWKNSQLEDCNLLELDFSESEMVECKFKNNNFSKVDFESVTFEDCFFESCDFTGAKFKRAIFYKCKFLNCKFKNSRFIEAILYLSEFKNSDIQKAINKNSEFNDCSFS